MSVLHWADWRQSVELKTDSESGDVDWLDWVSEWKGVSVTFEFDTLYSGTANDITNTMNDFWTQLNPIILDSHDSVMTVCQCQCDTHWQRERACGRGGESTTL